MHRGGGGETNTNQIKVCNVETVKKKFTVKHFS